MTRRSRGRRRTAAVLLGAAILLPGTRLAGAEELAPWMTDPRLGARRDAFGPGVHMDATGGVYRDSVPDAWLFPPFRHDAYGPGLGSDGTGRLVVPERRDPGEISEDLGE
jgi:hypothetical protein